MALPLSPLLNFSTPQRFTPAAITIAVEAPAPQLHLSVQAPATILPDTMTTLSVALSNGMGNPVEDGEVAMWVVDEALLELLPHALPSALAVQGTFSFDTMTSSPASSLDGLSSAAAADRALQITRTRLGEDAWQTPPQTWATRPCQGDGDLDRPDAAWLSSKLRCASCLVACAVRPRQCAEAARPLLLACNCKGT